DDKEPERKWQKGHYGHRPRRRLRTNFYTGEVRLETPVERQERKRLQPRTWTELWEVIRPRKSPVLQDRSEYWRVCKWYLKHWLPKLGLWLMMVIIMMAYSMIPFSIPSGGLVYYNAWAVALEYSTFSVLSNAFSEFHTLFSRF